MHTRALTIGSQTLSFETGKLAKQADGSVIVRFGDSVVLVTACRAATPREGIDFLPLTVDYREYAYASGRIPGGFFKREGKMADKEVLTSRMIDRPIRPLFPAGWRHETQIIALVLSADKQNDADVLAITGASAALKLAGIPFDTTIAGVRVGLVDGEYVINPTYEQRKKSLVDIVVAGSKDGLVMVEAGAKEVPEEQVAKALEAGHAAIKQIVADHRRPREGGRQAQAPGHAEDLRRRPAERGRGQGPGAADRGDADQGQARKLRDGRPGQRAGDGRLRGGRTGPQGRRQGDLLGAEGEGAPHRGARAAGAPRRTQVRRDPSDLDRGRRAAPHARVGGLHAWRDAGAGHLHARHGRRPAEDRARRRRVLQALHAPLQLPAVLGRRSAVHARPRPP